MTEYFVLLRLSLGQRPRELRHDREFDVVTELLEICVAIESSRT